MEYLLADQTDDPELKVGCCKLVWKAGFYR